MHALLISCHSTCGLQIVTKITFSQQILVEMLKYQLNDRWPKTLHIRMAEFYCVTKWIVVKGMAITFALPMLDLRTHTHCIPLSIRKIIHTLE